MSCILAIETSSHVGAVTLMRDSARPDQVVSEVIRDELKLSAWLLPAIARVQAQAGLSLREVDAIAFGAGPGSFTGVRTACATAQALAYAWQKPLIAVDSLEALAEMCDGMRISIVLDARMNEIYVASFTRKAAGELIRTSDTAVTPADAFQPPDDALLLGSGAPLIALPADSTVSRASAAAKVACENAWGQGIARVAARKLARGEITRPADAEPLYVRNMVALTEAERARRASAR